MHRSIFAAIVAFLLSISSVSASSPHAYSPTTTHLRHARAIAQNDNVYNVPGAYLLSGPSLPTKIPPVSIKYDTTTDKFSLYPRLNTYKGLDLYFSVLFKRSYVFSSNKCNLYKHVWRAPRSDLTVTVGSYSKGGRQIVKLLPARNSHPDYIGITVKLPYPSYELDCIPGKITFSMTPVKGG